MGYTVRVETSVEIIAKKMWHRGARITGRDIFDFTLVAEHERAGLLGAGQFMTRHAPAVFQRLEQRYGSLKKQPDEVDTIDYGPGFADAYNALKTALREMEPAQ